MMTYKDDLKLKWKQEEEFAFNGWDFSHIEGRWDNEALPWSYPEIVRSHLKGSEQLLDMGTGGGEFLLSLNHPYELTTVTEAYPPNVELCRRELAPRGIKVAQTYDDNRLPFAHTSFDVVINRHESFDAAEVGRVLKPGGYFITQQVGGKNNLDLSHRLCREYTPSFLDHTLRNNIAKLQEQGFNIHQAEEALCPLRFFDVGAIVYFAKIIEWEFPGFSVEDSFEDLLRCHLEIETQGWVESIEHRFVLVAQKLQ
ncbi:class I SAM-dependent methyltransferase [Paenibacillus sanguinis]|uniref:class I SAM-dependent methyltransferase n=1 Tax=Paenibacillus sanguinis TaxID=225906 RepID=UPI0003A3CD3B|nr:class I SAM-dependent methyltransferase [Paenibacillus sanguinis]